MKPLLLSFLFLVIASGVSAQSLLNVDFGVGSQSRKSGLAATGASTNDFWNLYRHYDPKYVPGSALVADGAMSSLKFADGSASPVSIAVTNAPGVWGNASGDAMYDTYIFAPNGSNIVVTLNGLEAGHYHLHLYGHADADVTGEQNSVFTIRSGTNVLGPQALHGLGTWKATATWNDRNPVVVFRDVPVSLSTPVVIEVAPGPNGIAVLNGLQISSRGTRPPRLTPMIAAPGVSTATNLIIREVKYDGRVSDEEARFKVTLEIESLVTNELSALLFEGDVALVAPKLPEALRLVSASKQYRLHVSAPGTYTLTFDLVAKISRKEPWNHISFTGPPAAIASVQAQAATAGVEMQLLSGTQLDVEQKAISKLAGFLASDRTLSMRWQSKATETARRSLVTAVTTASAQITPTVVKFKTDIRYEILQAPLARLTIAVPSDQALTKLAGDQIRDWQVKPDGARQLLTVEFIKPVEKSYALTVFSEQTVDRTPVTMQLVPPQPLDESLEGRVPRVADPLDEGRRSSLQRESGAFTIFADDTLVDLEATAGLRQVNATGGAIAAYRFHGRPILLSASLKRIEPLIKASDRATVRLEESRLLVAHALSLQVDRAGIYSLELVPPPGFVVSEVRGDGVEDWKVAGGTLHVAFTNRVLGARSLHVQLEQALKQFPESIVIAPLAITAATNLSVQIGAASPNGIRLKTAEMVGLRELSVTGLSARSGDELLAFAGEQPGWRLVLATEKLAPRIIAEVFGLVTIGEGLVGGSATIRYGIFNQGVQDFHIQVPAHWRNIEFTGPNIRRKEQLASANTNVVAWRIALQDKAWGAYTLVATYDYQFDPKGAELNVAGAHALNVERETGSIGIMSAAGLKLDPKAIAEPLRRVDESELTETDRALATRPLLLAYKYTGTNYALAVQVTRYEQLAVLDAIADRTELTTVLTEAGQMLTQGSFMVKNNEKQFQRFKLPPGSEFWSSYVNGHPARPERDGDWILVPLPRQANRDEAFAVDIVYAQKINLAESTLPQSIHLQAPVTDVPNTYAEWQLFAPMSQRLSSFGGNMMVAPYTTYELRDARREFVQFWGNAIDRHLGAIVFAFVVAGLGGLVLVGIRRGVKGLASALALLAIAAILASMMLPALAKAKAKAQRISAVNNLKQVALAARIYAGDHNNQFPNSFEEMRAELGNEKVLVDPATGQRFTWVGAGKTEDVPEAVLAYSVSGNGGVVALADGSVQQVSSDKLEEMLRQDGQRTASLPGTPALAAAAPPVARQAGGAQGPVPNPVSQTVTYANTGPTTNGTSGLTTGATAPGIRPIRIDVPRTGRAFTFTKVLNVGNEPLAVKTSVMKLRTFRVFQMVWQVTAFLAGLLMIRVLWQREPRNTFWLAIAAALIVVSVTNMLLTWRALHLVLIAAPPVLLMLGALWVLWRFVPKKSAELAPPIQPDGTIPTAAALIALTLFVGNGQLAAANQTELSPRPISSKAISILSANYAGIVREKVAEFEATVQISSAGTNETVNLFADDVAVQEFQVKSGQAKLLRDGRGVSVLLTNRGDVNLGFKLVAKVGGDVTKRQLHFTVPPALSSALDLTVDEAEADVEFPTAVAFSRTNLNDQTRVQAVLGSTDRVELNWTPRVKRAAEIAATVFVQSAALVTFGGGSVNTRAVFDYQVTQGELRQVRMRLPRGHRLLRVEGDGIRNWDLGGEGTALTVDLVKGMSPSYRLTVELERVLEALPVTTRVELPHALDVKRETGFIGVRGGEELALTIDSAKELQRVDLEEFNRALPGDSDGLIGAFRYFRSDFDLVARAESVQPQLEAAVRNTVRIGFEEIRVNAHIEYTIKRAGVFALRVALPAGYKLESVTGANIQQWSEKAEGGARLLEVALKHRATSRYALDVALVSAHQELPRTVPIQGVNPLDVEKISGLLTVASEPGVATKVESFDGLTEIPAASAGVQTGVEGANAILAFKVIGNEASATAGWKLGVTTETVEPWVRAEIVNHLTLTESLVSGRATVRYEIANAPVKEFALRIPAGFRNVDIAGANIRRRDQTGEVWRVELQGKVRGTFTLAVTWEMERGAQTNLLEFAGVQALNVERETGYVLVVAKPPVQVIEKTLGELITKIDVNEMPAWADHAGDTVLAFKYLRSGYRLALEVRRHEEAGVLQALIDNARFTTVVAEDGQMMTEMVLSVRNNGRQHLEVELPGNWRVWAAFVAGEAVRPNVRAGRLLLPMERSVDDAPASIELTFVSGEKFPKRSGTLALQSPKFDVPVKNVRWDLYLPPDYEYTDFEGSMTKSAESAPIVQMFSASGYFSQQNEKAAAAKAGVKLELSSVRSNLRGGNYKQALNEYSRARGKAQGQAEDRAELGVIEKEVRKVQSSNLIQAQRSYFNDNAARFGDALALNLPEGSVAQQAAKGLNVDYDATVAELQWSRLEAAQQVAKAQLAPLHINLPTRGVRLSFSQVLQTEVRTPMTVRVHAQNTKEMGWPKKVLWSAVGFAVLWMGVAGASARRRTS